MTLSKLFRTNSHSEMWYVQPFFAEQTPQQQIKDGDPPADTSERKSRPSDLAIFGSQAAVHPKQHREGAHDLISQRLPCRLYTNCGSGTILDPSTRHNIRSRSSPLRFAKDSKKAMLDIATRKRVAVSKSGEETQNLRKELTLTTWRGGDGDLAPFPPNAPTLHGAPDGLRGVGPPVHGRYRLRLLVPAHSDGDARRPRSAAEPSGGWRGRIPWVAWSSVPGPVTRQTTSSL